jgi:hypothetical protein
VTSLFITTSFFRKEKDMKKGLLAAIIAGLLVIGFVGIAPTLAQVGQGETEGATAPVTTNTASETVDDCPF